MHKTANGRITFKMQLKECVVVFLLKRGKNRINQNRKRNRRNNNDIKAKFKKQFLTKTQQISRLSIYY